MDFNMFVYYYTIFSAAMAVFIYFVSSKITRSAAVPSRFRASFGQENAEFTRFWRSFLVGYVPCLFADSLQAPYLYYLYASYGFIESQIAVLYIAGYATSITFALIGVYLVQRIDRRLLCLCFVALNSISCLMKFVDVYVVLLFSRVLDGIASSLLVTPFQEWYVHEHVVRYDFPKEWIPSTFRRVALVNAVLAVAAGFVAELSESTFKITAFPFLLAVPVLLFAGFYMHTVWHENRMASSDRPKFWSQFQRATQIILRDPSVLLLSAVQSLFEACIFMFIFFWTPVFLHVKQLMSVRPSFGGIYSSFMCSVLCGSLLHRVLSRRFTSTQLLCVSSAVATVAMSLASWLTYPSERELAPASKLDVSSNRVQSGQLHFATLLVTLGLYQLAVGLYFPSMQRCHRDILTPATDENTRAAVVAVFRVPLHVIAAGGLLLILHGGATTSDDGNWMMVTLCATLLTVCLLVCLLLLRTVAHRRSAAVQHLALQIQANQDDSDEDDVFPS